MCVCVWEEGLVEVGNSICVVRVISDSELFRIMSGLKSLFVYFCCTNPFFLFSSQTYLDLSLCI